MQIERGAKTRRPDTSPGVTPAPRRRRGQPHQFPAKPEARYDRTGAAWCAAFDRHYGGDYTLPAKLIA